MTATTKTRSKDTTTPKRIRKAPPEFLELSPKMRDKIFKLAPSVRNKLTIEGPDNCWVHNVGVMAQTAQPDGIRKSLGKYVWETFNPEDAPLYTGAVGDPMTISIRPLDSCVEGCVRPDHLTKMTATERSHRGRPEGITKYVGVVEHKQSGTFQARFHANGEMYSGGYFPTEREAAIRYDQMATFIDPDRPTNYSMGLLKVIPEPVAPNDRKLSSQYRGVFFNPPKDKWFARASLDGTQRHIGSFLTEEEAAIAYNDFVAEHGLDYPLNVIS